MDGGGLGIKRRNNLLATQADEAINERVLTAEDKSHSDKNFLSNLFKLPSSVSTHIELFKQSYYYKKYKIKVEGDLSESHQVALQNLWKNKTEKSWKYFGFALKHEEIKRINGESVICQLFELKIVLGIQPDERDLLDLKRAIGERDKRATWLLDSIGLQQHGETHKFTKLNETRKILLDGMKKVAKKLCTKLDAGFLELIGGQQTMEMAEIYSTEGNEKRAYYLMKYSAMCCYNPKALLSLMELKPEKDEYYKKLLEKAKNIFSFGSLSTNSGVLQMTSEDSPIEASL